MEIMTIANDNVFISSRDIASLTNKRHDHVLRDIESQIDENSLPKFGGWYKADNGQTYREYILPKNIAIGIVSGYSFDLRMKIINRLEQLENEKKIQNYLPDFNNPVESARAWADAKESEQKALILLDNQTKQLEYQKPLVSFAESVKATINSLLIRDWAKSIGIKEKEVRQWLNAKGYIYKQHDEWRMYASDNGYFEQTQSTFSTPYGGQVKPTVRITGKGQTALTEKIKNDLL